MKIYKTIISSIAGIILILNCPLSHSQQPQLPARELEKATKSADRDIREELEAKKPAVAPKKAPKKEAVEKEAAPEGPKLFVKKIKLEGAESLSLDVFKPALQEYENREVTLDELRLLAKRIERIYLENGVIAGCFVPAQDIVEGMVVLRIIEARLGETEISDHKYFDKERIAYYWELKPGDILRYDRISRSLQLANKNPDRRAKASLRAGTKPGTTDVAISADTNYPIHTVYSLDNSGDFTTGIWQKSAGFRHNNFLGFDDSLLGGYTWSDNTWGLYGYHTVPITNVGTSVQYGMSYSKTNPIGDYQRFELDTRAKNMSFYVYQDLFNKDTYIGDVYLGLDAKDKRVKMTTGVANRDRQRIIGIGGDFVSRDADSVTYIKPKIHKGVDLFGARNRDRLTSGQVDHVFTKYKTEVAYRKVLPANMQFTYALEGQWTFSRLAPQEQFSLGGMNSIRGYPAGNFRADNALQANAEMLFPAFFIPKDFKIPYAPRPLRDDVTGVIFFDYGMGAKRGREIWEDEELVNMCSYGAGVRTRLFDEGLLRLEWGFPLFDNPSTGSELVRFHVALDVQDNIFEELERIDKQLEEESIQKWSWKLLNEELKRPGSPLKKGLHRYLFLAQRFYNEGNLAKAKEYYERIYNITKSIHTQAENYVKGCVDQQKELEEINKLAKEHYRKGNLEEAKKFWKDVKKKAKIKPLTLEF